MLCRTNLKVKKIAHGGKMASDEDAIMEIDETGETEEHDEESSRPDQKPKSKVYLPRPLKEGEELEFDETAYVMYHEANTGDPCLSFDVLPDSLGMNRDEFPLSGYIVSGTQSDQSRNNKVIVMKMANLHKIKSKEDDDEDDDDDYLSDSDDEDEKPVMTSAIIKHNGCVNRIRATRIQGTHLAASWSEFAKVYIWDLTKPLDAVEDSSAMKTFISESKAFRPVFSFGGHTIEGYALDWSSTQEGYLATGDCRKFIHIWKPHESSWNVDQRPLTSHTASVEDIQWSPNEANVMASCSVDKSIRIWDIRAPGNKAAMLCVPNAHDSDINVINWNKKDSAFIVSGGDDGVIKVWDLKQFQSQTPVAVFKHHSAPITSVEWNPNDSTVFAAAGSDDQLTQWDLSVEKDDSEVDNDPSVSSIPPQLLFIHQGQNELKELHWHPQLPGVVISTANSGFNIFKTISV